MLRARFTQFGIRLNEILAKHVTFWLTTILRLDLPNLRPTLV